MPIESCSRSSKATSKVASRSLGSSGCHVSEIGFGTWGLGGTSQGAVAYGPTDDAESMAALRLAHERGVNFFDTADLYGHGHSEAILGRTFAERRASIFLATKVGFVGMGSRQDFSPACLDGALTRSLRRLQTDYVDLLQLHSPPLDLLFRAPVILDWLLSAKRSGKARLVGISVRSPDEGLSILRDFTVDAIQVNFNLVDQRALENGLLHVCAARDVGVIVRTPLCFGFLSGTVGEDDSFANTDHRSRWSPAQRRAWARAQDLFESCMADGTGQTRAQFALRYCLSQPGVATVIPGMLTCAHVEENLAASGLGALSPESRETIAEVYRAHTFFLGQ